MFEGHLVRQHKSQENIDLHKIAPNKLTGTTTAARPAPEERRRVFSYFLDSRIYINSNKIPF